MRQRTLLTQPLSVATVLNLYRVINGVSDIVVRRQGVVFVDAARVEVKRFTITKQLTKLTREKHNTRASGKKYASEK